MHSLGDDAVGSRVNVNQELVFFDSTPTQLIPRILLYAPSVYHSIRQRCRCKPGWSRSCVGKIMLIHSARRVMIFVFFFFPCPLGWYKFVCLTTKVIAFLLRGWTDSYPPVELSPPVAVTLTGMVIGVITIPAVEVPWRFLLDFGSVYPVWNVLTQDSSSRWLSTSSKICSGILLYRCIPIAVLRKMIIVDKLPQA